jgi:hypothetical protein
MYSKDMHTFRRLVTSLFFAFACFGMAGAVDSNPYNPANYSITLTKTGEDLNEMYFLVNGLPVHTTSTHDWSAPWVVPPQFPTSHTSGVNASIAATSSGSYKWTVTWIGTGIVIPDHVYVSIASQVVAGGPFGNSTVVDDGLSDPMVQMGINWKSAGSQVRRVPLFGGIGSETIQLLASSTWSGFTGTVSTSLTGQSCTVVPVSLDVYRTDGSMPDRLDGDSKMSDTLFSFTPVRDGPALNTRTLKADLNGPWSAEPGGLLPNVAIAIAGGVTNPLIVPPSTLWSNVVTGDMPESGASSLYPWSFTASDRGGQPYNETEVYEWKLHYVYENFNRTSDTLLNAPYSATDSPVFFAQPPSASSTVQISHNISDTVTTQWNVSAEVNFKIEAIHIGDASVKSSYEHSETLVENTGQSFTDTQNIDVPGNYQWWVYVNWHDVKGFVDAYDQAGLIGLQQPAEFIDSKTEYFSLGLLFLGAPN